MSLVDENNISPTMDGPVLKIQPGGWAAARSSVLTKPFDSPAHSTPNFLANATYILHPEGGGISLLYYHSNVATPTHCTDGTAIGKASAAIGEVCGVTGASAASPFGTVGNPILIYPKLPPSAIILTGSRCMHPTQ